jgi:hypothetical protein
LRVVRKVRRQQVLEAQVSLTGASNVDTDHRATAGV